MASVQSLQGTHQRAMMSHYKALDLLKRIHGEVHESIADTYVMMGAALLQQKRLSKAMKVYKDATDIYKTIHGDEHSRVTNVYKQIAKSLDLSGNYSEATEYRKKAAIQIH